MIIGLYTVWVKVVKRYELDLYCSQIISSVPCLSVCSGMEE